MQDSITEIKKGIKLHSIKNNRFKTNLISVFITTPLDRKNLTENALIPAVLRRGTKNIQTQEEINKKLEEMYGAEFDCGIEKIGDNQVIKFYIEALNDKFLPNNEELLKSSINLLLEIVFNPLVKNDEFDSKYIETEKRNLEQLIQSKIDNKDLYAFERTVEEMYKNKPYSLYKYGYVEDLEEITQKGLYNRYKNLIKEAKIDIFVSGEFEEASLIEILKNNENIVKLSERNPIYIINKEETEIKEKIDNVREIEDRMNVTQGKIVIGMQIKEMKQNERFIAILYNTILGDSANSKMFQNVREKAHLAYSARSSYIRQKNDIFIRCGIEINNYEKALNIIKEQIDDMKNGNFTDEDINNAKQYIISSILGVEEEQDTGITYYLGQELSNIHCTLEQYEANIQNITKEQIQNLANMMEISTIYFLRN